MSFWQWIKLLFATFTMDDLALDRFDYEAKRERQKKRLKHRARLRQGIELAPLNRS